MKLALILATLMVVALAPLSEAHIQSFQQAAPLVIGPYNAIAQPRPDPMFANSALSMTAIFSRVADGTYAPNLPVTLELIAPDGTSKTTRMESDGTGYLIASMEVKTPGSYTANFHVQDGGASYVNGTEFTAYPDLPFRLQSEDPDQPDPETNSSYVISIESVDHITLQRMDAFTDLTLTLESWSDDHKTLYGETSHAMKNAGKGLWRLDHKFPAAGMFHLRFSSVSGDFKPGDTPILHVYARDPIDGGPTKGTPLPGLALVLVAAGLAIGLRQRG